MPDPLQISLIGQSINKSEENRRISRQNYFILLLTFGSLMFFSFLSQKENGIGISIFNSFVENRRENGLKKTAIVPGSKWIVVTTIQYPTEDLKNLASQPGWDVVVVADMKTPSDWNLPGVHFLSLEKQRHHFGEFSGMLPFHSYTRKNLGYLYAIMNGAEWIYDTDDDNKPYGLGLNQFDYLGPISGLRYFPRLQNISERLFNPYRFYGYKNMWPRGFPLEYLERHTNGRDRMISCREMAIPAVQQGVVSSDPDVDAIYRLLYARKESGLNVTFNNIAPSIILEKGTYSPWNSQNTLFHYKAFFILYLPSSVAFRVTDIWRSYFGQKLLHLIGENVGFYPANAVQIRNAHNYLDDFKQETDVYKKSGKMVEFLNDWNCSARTTVGCVKELADHFVKLQFFEQTDRNLIEVWLEELTRLGYNFPDLISNFASSSSPTEPIEVGTKYGNCRVANLNLGIGNYGSEHEKDLYWASQAVNGFGEILNWCEILSNATTNLFLPSPADFLSRYQLQQGMQNKKNTVLVLMNNHPWALPNTIGILQRLYSPFFKTTIFCGIWMNLTNVPAQFPPIEPLNFVHILPEEMRGGGGYGYCIPKVRDLRLQNVDGYYFVADDATFNFWHDIPQKKFVNPEPIVDELYWWNPVDVQRSYDLFEGKYKNHSRYSKSWQRYNQALAAKYPETNITHHYLNVTRKTIGDFLFIPQGDTLDYVSNLMEVLIEAEVFVEVSIGIIMDGLDFDRVQPFDYLWWGRRALKLQPYNTSLIGMHPTKFSMTQDDLEYRREFCDSVIKGFGIEVYGQTNITKQLVPLQLVQVNPNRMLPVLPAGPAMTQFSQFPAGIPVQPTSVQTGRPIVGNTGNKYIQFHKIAVKSGIFDPSETTNEKDTGGEGR